MVSYSDLFALAQLVIDLVAVVLMAVTMVIAIYNIKK